MTVTRLDDGFLWVHSPVEFTPELKSCLDRKGPVRFAVGPNLFHHLFLGNVKNHYPDARLYGAPGLAKKHSAITLDSELGNRSPPEWRGTFDQHLVTGIPGLSEVAFLHRPTRTLIVTDLVFNIADSPSWWMRVLFRTVGAYGRVAPSRLLKSLIRDHKALRHSIDTILEWDFERAILSHGLVMESEGKSLLAKAYDWL